MNTPKWRTKHGKFIDVTQMATPHIENCVKLLKRKGLIGIREYVEKAEDAKSIYETPSAWIDLFEEELEKRKEREQALREDGNRVIRIRIKQIETRIAELHEAYNVRLRYNADTLRDIASLEGEIATLKERLS